jgi:hypothetical protein
MDLFSESFGEDGFLNLAAKAIISLINMKNYFSIMFI